MEWLVTESVELVARVAKGPLSSGEVAEIQRQAQERLAARDPLLRHALDVKVVINPRRNFLNVSVRREFVTLCYSECIAGTHYCYFVSDKLEPFVIATAVDPVEGRLVRLTRRQCEDFARSLEGFRRRFGLANETYHYTPLAERVATDSFSSAAPPGTKGHSTNWHLKIRVATVMISHILPVFNLIDLATLRTTLEPVKYNFSRSTLPWEETYRQILADAS
jgi:hypothetical protein